ncbi:thiol-disulfide oxidoreductase DCC family protein [Marixanthomonas ophiurae]|uniref:Thiol-disulfide oxidoreductase DCC family protein n=1 Tax=Marixanthomonas ophiurae TaxID=387659 RepID=A0A3E1Q7K4_9FLAO|nr:thiol-disulfide oxidoreductase DCC family protein [Marixanthomonas ophiurae]RFN58111.1 thiol-disulfide oxidoreductase DCC family protein [Marixanthomonas ophiurae]
MNSDKTHKIILFDGVCNLCNSSVVFAIKRDKNDVFRFAALQSKVGEQLISKLNIDTSKTDSIILIDGEKYHEKSSAALRIAKQLSGGWPLLYVFIILPEFIRDSVYSFIAKNRYKWYGKRESCMIPTPELQAKFL